MKTAIVFDTETTGLPSATHEIRLVSLAWIVIQCDGDNNDGKWHVCTEHVHVVKPDGFMIPDRATHVHGISTEYAMHVGESVEFVLEKFMESVSKCDMIVAHNCKYDTLVISTELRKLQSLTRINWCAIFETIPKVCTMRLAQQRFGGRSMSLSNTYLRMYAREWDAPLHNALHDTRCCAEIFFYLINDDFCSNLLLDKVDGSKLNDTSQLIISEDGASLMTRSSDIVLDLDTTRGDSSTYVLLPCTGVCDSDDLGTDVEVPATGEVVVGGVDTDLETVLTCS